MDLFEQEDPSQSSSSSEEVLNYKDRRDSEYNIIPAPEPNISTKKRSPKESKVLRQAPSESESSMKKPTKKSQKGRRIKSVRPTKVRTKHIVHHSYSNSQSGSDLSIASASDIKEIKDSLKDHFDAIKSLQNALSFSDLRMFNPAENKNNTDGPDLREKLELIERALYSLGKRFDQTKTVINRSGDPEVKKAMKKLQKLEPNEQLNTEQNEIQLEEDPKVVNPLPDQTTIPPPPIFTTSAPPQKSTFPVEEVVSSAGIVGSQSFAPSNTRTSDSSLRTTEPLFMDRLMKLETRLDVFTQQIESKMAKTENKPPQELKRLETMFTNLQMEMQKMRHDFILQQKLNEQLVDLNYGLEQKVKELQAFIAGFKENKNVEPPPMPTVIDENLIRQTCKSMLKKYFHAMNESLKNKVDLAILEELAQHIATKDDLKKFTKKSHIQKLLGKHAFELESVHSTTQQELHQQLESVLMTKMQRLEGDFDAKLRTAIQSIHTEKRSKLDSRAMSELELRIEQSVIGRTSRELELRVEKWMSAKSKELKDQLRDLMKLNSGAMATSSVGEGASLKISDLDMNPIVRQLTRDFDEKLYVLCTELSSCKQNFAAQALQPFYRCGQWLWTCGTLKLGSAVPWNIETTNTGIEL
jgi:hypothetical protein